jgi:hypothetical protein
MDFSELSLEQRRQLIDAQQLFSAWRPAAFELSSMGGLYWNTSKGRRYLYEKREGKLRSLGRETAELKNKKTDHDQRVKELRARLRPLASRIEKIAPVNRAIGIGHLPSIAAKILREIDMEGLLGSHIIVAGTNALYAYETAAGVRVGGEHVATGDADLLWDARRSLQLSSAGVVRRQGFMSILKRADSTFVAQHGLVATNSTGYIVDLIIPEQKPPEMVSAGGVDAQPIEGMEWLLAAPQLEQTLVATDGMPLRIVVPEPRTFALHKLWVSRRPGRTPLKKPKDEAHSRIVATLAEKYLSLPLVAKEMPWLPTELKSLVKDLKAATRA